jgi:hypothetical protein
MTRRRILLIAIPVVLLLVAAGAAAAVWFARPKQVTVTLQVTGTRGLPFKGTAEVDGRSQDLSGTIPAQFELKGSRVIFTFVSTEDSGEMQVKGLIDGIAFGSGTTRNPPQNGIRGWVNCGWASSTPGSWYERFDRDNPPKWMVPPP